MENSKTLSQSEFFEADIPSARANLLKSLKSSKVSKLVRYSWKPLNEVAKQIEERFKAPPSSVFRRTWGPLLVFMESGLILGFGEQPSEASITVWVERNEDGQQSPEDSLLDDPEAYCIDVSDQVYSEGLIHNLIGQEISHVSIVERDNPRWAREVAGEVGVVLGFENGVELIISLNLCENIDDYAIILRDEIDPEILDQLQEISL